MILAYSLNISIPEGKTPVEKERLNILFICNEISFFNSFSIFVGKILGPTDLLSFNDEIKSIIQEFCWHAAGIHGMIYLKTWISL